MSDTEGIFLVVMAILLVIVALLMLIAVLFVSALDRIEIGHSFQEKSDIRKLKTTIDKINISTDELDKLWQEKRLILENMDRISSQTRETINSIEERLNNLENCNE